VFQVYVTRWCGGVSGVGDRRGGGVTGTGLLASCWMKDANESIHIHKHPPTVTQRNIQVTLASTFRSTWTRQGTQECYPLGPVDDIIGHSTLNTLSVHVKAPPVVAVIMSCSTGTTMCERRNHDWQETTVSRLIRLRQTKHPWQRQCNSTVPA
jgi:hypothetical protein